jgi:Arylsulfotransferase (ASST)
VPVEVAGRLATAALLRRWAWLDHPLSDREQPLRRKQPAPSERRHARLSLRAHGLPKALVGLGAVVALANVAMLAYGARRILTSHTRYTARSTVPCAPAELNRSAVLPGTTLAVSPLPGSRDASPATQISLLGTPGVNRVRVRVRGSASGGHSGRLAPYSQGDGFSFLPEKPFLPGESVTVRGAVGTKRFAFRFQVARQDQIPYTPPGKQSFGTASQIQRFHSRPDLIPPSVDVTTDAPAADPGYVFAAPYTGPGQDGPLIFDNSGQLVWMDPLPFGTEAANFKVDQLEGRPVLTWWQGYIPPQGFGEGEEIVADGSYHVLARIRAGNGLRADLHDFHLTSNDTALLTAFDAIRCDLSSVGGRRDAAVSDGVFQEIDLKTGLVRREWHSLDHVALSESHASAADSSRPWPFDYFHINSVEPAGSAETLISARNTWGVYKLETRSGQVLWTLGGKQSSFHMGPGTTVAYQHDASELPDGTLTIFDNGGVPKVHHQSRAIQVAVDADAKTVTLLRQLTHSPPLSSGSQANFQSLPGGRAFVGWGLPYFTEYDTNGQVLFDAHLHGANESYRAYRFAWTGTPSTPPAIATDTDANGTVKVYASWNGATAVRSWRLLAGTSAADLRTVRTFPRTGFESSTTDPASEPYVAVQALDAAGTVLASSRAVAR